MSLSYDPHESAGLNKSVNSYSTMVAPEPGQPSQDVPFFLDSESSTSDGKSKAGVPKIHPFYASLSRIFGGPNRWIVLAITCMLTLGSYFSYDEIGALSTILYKELHLNPTQYSLLYAIYHIPNALGFAFIGGFYTDKVGTRLGSLTFAFLVAVGTLIVAVGGHVRSFYVMLLGRFIFGLGGESLAVAQNAIITEWFNEDKLAFAFGISLTVSRAGTALVFNFEDAVANYTGSFVLAFYFTFLLTLYSLINNVILVYFDKAAEVTGNKPNSANIEDGVSTPSTVKFNLNTLRQFNIEFWLLTICVTVFYSFVFPFQAQATKFFVEKYGFTLLVAGRYASIVIIASMVLSPLMGQFVDKYGYRSYSIMIGGALLIPATLLLGFTDITPLPALSMIGFAFSLVPAACWPSTVLLVPEEYIATAYGLMTTFQNIGLFGGNLIAGAILSKYDSYERMFLFFLGLVVTGLISAIALHFMQLKRHNDVMNKSLKQIVEETEERLAKESGTSVRDIHVLPPKSPLSFRV